MISRLTFKARCPSCGHIVRHRIRNGIVVREKCYSCNKVFPMFVL